MPEEFTLKGVRVVSSRPNINRKAQICRVRASDDHPRLIGGKTDMVRESKVVMQGTGQWSIRRRQEGGQAPKRRVWRPEGSTQLLAGDDLSFRFQKQPQHLERLILNRHTHPGPEQFTATQIDTEKVKAYGRATEGTVCSQRKPQRKCWKCNSFPLAREFDVFCAANCRVIQRLLQFTTSSPAVHCTQL